jgi:transposase
VERDWRDERIEELEADVGHYKAVVAARDEVIAERDRVIDELMAKVVQLTARVAKLEEQLRKSSRNSSKPPSSDAPTAAGRPKKPPTGRKAGGQPGHEQHERELVAPEKVSKIVACIPKECEDCGKALRGKDPAPHRHQVFELPKVEPEVTEYQQHSLGCDCGHTTRGKLPNGVPTGAFGPGVVAVVAVMMGVYRLSKRMVSCLMVDLFGLRMSLGAVVGCQQQASDAIARPVEDAKKYVVEQPVKHADETSWREGVRRSRAWLWAVATSKVVVFMVHARRNTDAARALLVRVAGVLISDRHGAYSWWPDRLRQLCWAHIRRDVQAIIDRGGQSAVIGRGLLEETDRMFHWWHRVRDGTLSRASFRVYMRSLRTRFEAGLTLGTLGDHPKTAKTCANLLKHADALWTFVRVDEVEPTNNSAEQVVRHGVILRKISHGTHSEAGSRFIERILTVHASLRRQERNVLDFLRDACSAHLNRHAPPSLLPMTASRVQLARAA